MSRRVCRHSLRCSVFLFIRHPLSRSDAAVPLPWRPMTLPFSSCSPPSIFYLRFASSSPPVTSLDSSPLMPFLFPARLLYANGAPRPQKTSACKLPWFFFSSSPAPFARPILVYVEIDHLNPPSCYGPRHNVRPPLFHSVDPIFSTKALPRLSLYDPSNPPAQGGLISPLVPSSARLFPLFFLPARMRTSLCALPLTEPSVSPSIFVVRSARPT